MSSSVKRITGFTSAFSSINSQITLQIALLFAPLAYCIHQIEESTGAFRTWRLRHFPDNNSLPVEYVFVILTALTLFLIILFSIRKSKPTAQFVVLFLMATQVQNAFYHVGAGIYFADYSPGTITALLLYLPINFYIVTKAIQERWLTKSAVWVIFILGGIMFWSFELIGPVIIAVFFGLGLVYVVVSELRTNVQKLGSI